MNKQKGSILIIIPFIILAVGLVALNEYRLNEKMNNIEQTFAGSVVATKYGGTGQSFGSASGLLRLTNGTTSTTTLTDSDIPDDITVTGIAELTLSTSTVTSTLDAIDATSYFGDLYATSASTTLGWTIFDTHIPILPTATATADFHIPSRVFITEGYLPIGNTFATGTISDSEEFVATTTSLITVNCIASGGGSTVFIDLVSPVFANASTVIAQAGESTDASGKYTMTFYVSAGSSWWVRNLNAMTCEYYKVQF